MRRNGVRVAATCVDHIYQGNSANSERARLHRQHRGRPLHALERGCRPRLVPAPGGAAKSPVSLGVGWTSLAVLLIAAGTLAVLLG
jgi:hypothetical protein